MYLPQLTIISHLLQLVSCVRNIRSTLLKLGNVSTGDEYDCIIVQGSGTFGVESVLASDIALPAQDRLVQRT